MLLEVESKSLLYSVNAGKCVTSQCVGKHADRSAEGNFGDCLGGNIKIRGPTEIADGR